MGRANDGDEDEASYYLCTRLEAVQLLGRSAVWETSSAMIEPDFPNERYLTEISFIVYLGTGTMAAVS